MRQTRLPFENQEQRILKKQVTKWRIWWVGEGGPFSRITELEGFECFENHIRPTFHLALLSTGAFAEAQTNPLGS